MKLTDYIIVFVIILGCFSATTFYYVNTESKAGIANAQYTNALTAACEDAAKTMKAQKTEEGIWQMEEDRSTTLSTFFDTLNFCFNTELTDQASDIYQFVPIVCLVDNNGYYISYNEAFDGNGNFPSTTDQDARAYSESMTVSAINTWTKTYGNYIVRFYLDDTIEIICPNNRVVKDTREGIIQLQKKENFITDTGLKAILQSEEEYETQKNEVIIRSINEEVEYYINHQNIWAAGKDIMYSFTMPEIASEDWHRLLTNPSILSFLQGRQAQASKNYVNVYALGGGEVTRETSYFITSDNTYHYLGAGACNDHDIDYVETEEHYTYKNNGSSRTVTTTVGSYTCDGEIIEHTYDSMEACAIQGAYPCSCVLNHNHLQ